MNTKSIKNIFLSRPSYQVFPLELPPLSKKERDKVVKNKLRGLYPGNLENKLIVTRPNRKRGSYLSFIFNDDLKDDPLSVSTLAALKFCKKGKRYCVIAWENWIEYLVLEDGRVLSSSVTFMEHQLKEQVATNAEKWFGIAEDKILIEVFCEPNKCPSNSFIETGTFDIKFIPIEKDTLMYSIPACSCFPGRLPQVKLRRRILSVVCIVLTVIALINIRSWYIQREAEREAQREANRLMQLELAEQRAREELLNNLREAWENKIAEQQIGVYSTMEVLASCLSPAIRLLSASVKEDGSFRLEGTATDAIAALKDLQEHPRINNADIGTIVLDGRADRFTVNGTVEQQLLLPKEDLSDMEKIAWYEAVLVTDTKYENLPETAAEAAQQIRDLLRKHRLSITRYRYLEAQKGWAIECVLSGTAIQLIQVLKEVDDMGQNASMRTTALETRNRNITVDITITFFVRGPGEANHDRDYEENPSVLKIARLYGAPPARAPAAAGERLPATANTPVVYSSWMEYVGLINGSDGKRYIYIKDNRSGDIFRLSEGTGDYSFSYNNTGDITARLGGYSGIIEVRRNDGF